MFVFVQTINRLPESTQGYQVFTYIEPVMFDYNDFTSLYIYIYQNTSSPTGIYIDLYVYMQYGTI